jgi:hypothetical protein
MKYYEQLGLTNEATSEEVKKAYRKLAKENHPDTGGDEETFKKIAEAYGVLSDGTKRDRYDRGEPVEAESKEGRARRNLCKMFDTIINSDLFDPASANIPVLINGEINETLLKMESDVEDAEIFIRKLEDVKGRIEGADYLVEKIENSISMTGIRIDKINQEIEIAGVMSEINEGFKYEQDEESENEEIEYDEEFGAFW